MAKVGWWLAAAGLPLVIWPALDWSHPVALALTDYWFVRTDHMPSWTTTGTVQAVFAVVFGVASGLVLFLGLRAMKKAGAADRVGWLSVAVSVVVAVGSARSLPLASGDPGYATAMAAQVTPGLAMAAGAVAAQVRRRPKTV